MTSAADRILALAEDERGDGEFEGPEHEEWRAEIRALVAAELQAAVAPFQAIIEEQGRTLGALARAVGNYLDHPGCNNPARATAMAKLRWAMEQSQAVR